MPRSPRYAPANSVHHVINRGNERRVLFAANADFARFLKLMGWAKQQCPMRILAYCLMPNHWHMVLWPEQRGDLSRFMQRLCTAHAITLRRVTSTVGLGHVYQHRYHAFAVESEAYYYYALRYVEANPLRAGLVGAAKDWEWSSLPERLGENRGLIEDGPLKLPPRWPELVDTSVPADVLTDLRKRLRRRTIC